MGFAQAAGCWGRTGLVQGGFRMNNIRTAVIYGDSISTTEYGEGGCQELIRQGLGLEKVYNHAVSSSGLSASTPDSLVSILQEEQNRHHDADLILLWHGTNDWYWGAPLGESGSKDLATFTGAAEFAIRTIQESAPQAMLLWLMPMYRLQEPFGCTVRAEAWENPNTAGYIQADYARVIWELSGKYCFPVLDMRRLTGFNAYNAPRFLPDGIHPSREGYLRIAERLTSYIQTF